MRLPPGTSEAGRSPLEAEALCAPTPTSDRPYVLIFGHLGGVPSRQALEYVRGLALKAVQEEAISYYGLHKTATGIAFEIHEGGPGKALLPSLLAHVKSWGPYEQGESHHVDVATNSRTVRVVRTASGGISSVQLSEGAAPQRPLDVAYGKALQPLAQTGDGFVLAGKVVFGAGALACLAAAAALGLGSVQAARSVPTRPAVAVPNLPSAGFAAMLAAGHVDGVNALRFQAGSWMVQTDEGAKLLSLGATHVAQPAGTAASAASGKPQ